MIQDPITYINIQISIIHDIGWIVYIKGYQHSYYSYMYTLNEYSIFYFSPTKDTFDIIKSLDSYQTNTNGY